MVNNSHPQVAIPLHKKNRLFVTIGAILLMFSIAGFGLSLALLQGPILESMNAMHYFSTMTIFASLGLSIMTPIGGKLGDLFGRRNIVVIFGLLATVCGIGLAFIRQPEIFLILRLLLGAAQGAFTSAPYILMGEIYERESVPKAMGYLASAVAIGGFGSSILAGFLADQGFIELGILFSVVPLLLGVALIAFFLPNVKREGKVLIDYPGIAMLTLFLSSFLLSLNYAPRMGWTSPIIIIGLVLSVVFLYLLVKVENKASEPIIPMHLFLNKGFVTLLIVGVTLYYYQNQMNVYAPLAVLGLLEESATVSGALQLPRTIVVMVLPSIVGIWVSKHRSNYWKAMAVAAAILVFAFIPLAFTNPSTPVWIFFLSITLTGVSESLRSVSVTPAAQSMLEPENLGIGTSLVTFMNSMASLLAATFSGVIFDVNADNLNRGINQIFGSTALVSLVGFLLVIFVVRKVMQPDEETKQKKKLKQS